MPFDFMEFLLLGLLFVGNFTIGLLLYWDCYIGLMVIGLMSRSENSFLPQISAPKCDKS